MVIVMDDENRENEGDLVMAAQFATGTDIATMIRFTSDCLRSNAEGARRQAKAVSNGANRAQRGRQDAYTVRDAADSHTGISAIERCRTVRNLATEVANPESISRPGHVFPLIARAGGVLERRGHTEASVDLCRLAGLRPVGVIGELMNDDGTTMNLAQCRSFARTKAMSIINIDQLVRYLRQIQVQQAQRRAFHRSRKKVA